jgi:hypothetical protein
MPATSPNHVTGRIRYSVETSRAIPAGWSEFNVDSYVSDGLSTRGAQECRRILSERRADQCFRDGP